MSTTERGAATAYTPTPDSTAWQVLSFFANNPDEELLTTDIVTKFEVVDMRAVYKRLETAVGAGYLLRKKKPHKRSPVCVYSAGPQLAAFAALLQRERQQWETAP